MASGVYPRVKSWARPRCQLHPKIKLQDGGCARCEREEQRFQEYMCRLLARGWTPKYTATLAVDPERPHVTVGLDCWCGPIREQYGADGSYEEG